MPSAARFRRSAFPSCARGSTPMPAQRLTPEDFVPVLEYDGEIRLDEVDHDDFWEALQKLEPFGSGNPAPVFVARDAKLVQPPRIMKEKHLKLRVALPASRRQRPIPARAGGSGLAHGRARRAGAVAGGRCPRPGFHRGLQPASRLRRGATDPARTFARRAMPALPAASQPRVP